MHDPRSLARPRVVRTAIQAWPRCPSGHAGEVRPHGFRKRKDGLYARPVFECHHDRCDASCAIRRQRSAKPCAGVHYFTEPAQARTHEHPDGLWCVECSRERSLRDGLPVGHGWDFEALLIADALIAVGRGASYRKAAQAMRLAARRFELVGDVPIVSLRGNTLMRYLDYFGELVQREVDPAEWPEVLLLDALPLRKREEIEGDPFSFEQSGNGAILIAVGYSQIYEEPRRRRRNEFGQLVEVAPRVRRRPHLWLARLAGGYNRWAWADFLAELPGTPRWIVADGDAAVRLGVKLRWGDGPDAPIVYSCEAHLQRKFRDRALTQDRMVPVEVAMLWPEHRPDQPDPPPAPLWSRDHYRRFLDAALAFAPDQVENITSWITLHNDTIERQFELRDAHPGFPRGNGPVETAILELQRFIGDRHKQFQNVYRTNIALGLMRSHLGGHDDISVYTRLVRDELARPTAGPKSTGGSATTVASGRASRRQRGRSSRSPTTTSAAERPSAATTSSPPRRNRWRPS